MNWKVSLDRHLTTESYDGYDSWCEALIEELDEVFYDENQEWIFIGNAVTYEKDYFSKWSFKLFNLGKTPKQASIFIQRLYRLYIG